MALKRFFIEDTDPLTSDRDAVVKQVQAYGFRSIEDSAVEEAVGWVPPTRQFDSEFVYEDVFLDSHLFLNMRIDQKTVSRVLVDTRVNAMLHHGEASPKSRSELKQLKEDVEKELMGRTLPSARIVEAVVDLQHRTLYLNTASNRTSRIFINLFEKTFGILPEHLDPTVFAYVSIGDTARLQGLSQCEETCFHDI